jgi:hypothetical protein
VDVEGVEPSFADSVLSNFVSAYPSRPFICVAKIGALLHLLLGQRLVFLVLVCYQ